VQNDIPPPDRRFRRSERLKSRRTIGRLFDRQGETAVAYPLRLMWLPVPEPHGAAPVQFTLSVPKRRFRRAADRNLLRRRIREAYRRQKQLLAPALATAPAAQYAVVALYTGREIQDYRTIERSMRRLLRKFADRIGKSPA
jgi:ribonuclease P protein component